MKKIRCIHCLEWFEPSEITGDHVLPDSWYPDSTPKDLEKWQVPSCGKCNNALGFEEEYVRLRIALGLDPNKQATKGIVEKALRSIDPTLARDDKDRKFRIKLRESIKRNFFKIGSSKKGLLPNFDKLSSKATHGQFVKAEVLIKVFKKVLRGIIFKLNNTYIEQRDTLEVYIVEEGQVKDITRNMETYGKKMYRGPGFVFWITTIPDKNKNSVLNLLKVKIWGKLIFYGFVEQFK